MKKFLTSESVTEGHADKLADQISDAVLDYILERDPMARVACETMLSKGLVIVSGEISTDVYAPIEDIVRETIKSVGYTDSKYGLDYKSCAVLISLHSQSEDISMGVDGGGAGDQGIMFGYATNETEEYMPLPIMLAHSLAQRLALVRKNGILEFLGPDGKTQVTVEYDGKKPVRVDTVLISSQHLESIGLNDLKESIKKEVIYKTVPSHLMDSNTKIYINPTGRFVLGGPAADVGLTGRKIILDTYGGACRHGGGAFSGKDPTKVDRSAAYAARWMAKNIVAAGLTSSCEVQLSYAIGVDHPISISLWGGGEISEKDPELLNEVFDLTPNGIIKSLDLRNTKYLPSSTYGHFGRANQGFRWEEKNMVEIVKKLFH